jgi:predicted nucleotide-binding protein
MQMLDGHFDWSSSEDAPGPDGIHKGIRIILAHRTSEKLWPRDVLSVASSLLTPDEKLWIIPGDEQWTIDAGELKHQLLQGVNLPWFEGRLSVKPAVDVSETDVYGTTEYENRLALDFYPATAASTDVGAAPDPRRVYVVHGRNIQARDAMFSFLRAAGLQPIEWSEALALTGKPTPYVGEVLNTAFGQARAIVVLMTPDDIAQLRPQFLEQSDQTHERSPTPQARANVIFEAGMAMGRNPDRTVIVELGSPLRPFSDIGGRHTLRLTDSTARRQELLQRLETAGCAVNSKGTDWHTAGNFGSAVSDDTPVRAKAPLSRADHGGRAGSTPPDGKAEGSEADAAAITFDFAPDTPAAHGWKVKYSPTKPPRYYGGNGYDGRALTVQPMAAFEMRRALDSSESTARCLRLTLGPRSNGYLLIEVRLEQEPGVHVQKTLLFALGKRQYTPRPTADYTCRGLREDIAGGWYYYHIDLVEALQVTIGDGGGLQFRNATSLALCGPFTVSRIALSREPTPETRGYR